MNNYVKLRAWTHGPQVISNQGRAGNKIPPTGHLPGGTDCQSEHVSKACPCLYGQEDGHHCSSSLLRSRWPREEIWFCRLLALFMNIKARSEWRSTHKYCTYFISAWSNFLPIRINTEKWNVSDLLKRKVACLRLEWRIVRESPAEGYAHNLHCCRPTDV